MLPYAEVGRPGGTRPSWSTAMWIPGGRSSRCYGICRRRFMCTRPPSEATGTPPSLRAATFPRTSPPTCWPSWTASGSAGPCSSEGPAAVSRPASSPHAIPIGWQGAVTLLGVYVPDGASGHDGPPGPGLCSGRGGPADSAGGLVPDGVAVADFRLGSRVWSSGGGGVGSGARRPFSMGGRGYRGGRSHAQQSPSQEPRLEDTRRSPQRPSTIDRISRCCIHWLNLVNTDPGPSPASATNSASHGRWARSAPAPTTRPAKASTPP